ncbi:MAG: tetratricopeptide repeat protein [Coleofasciculus sp. A1-SPW-01]|uniref:tetratricopeptide repeat protein n=1 Tax=Coleofasciculus sp. A1-SPW-01 TaxID=3070819 RepID=UPI0032F0F6BF
MKLHHLPHLPDVACYVSTQLPHLPVIPLLATVSLSLQLLKIPIASATSGSLANGQILQTLGKVTLKRATGSLIQPTPGTPLYPGDELQTAQGGEIIIQCSNLTLWSLKNNQNRLNTCPPQSQDNQDAKCTQDITECPERGDELARNDPSLPYIISPRRTQILSDQPLLRWNPVSGATEYTVKVSGGGNQWQTQTSDTAIPYSGDFPLKPDIYYTLKIEADTGSLSIDENTSQLGFTPLNSHQRQQLQTAINQLNSWNLNPEAKALSLAYLYNQHNLKAKAIQTLENLIQQTTPTPATHRQLGTLYQQIGLTNLAETHYQQALKLATPDNIEEQALATLKLAHLYTALHETEKAITHLNQALSHYQTLNNSQQINQLNHQLETLTNQ